MELSLDGQKEKAEEGGSQKSELREEKSWVWEDWARECSFCIKTTLEEGSDLQEANG